MYYSKEVEVQIDEEDVINIIESLSLESIKDLLNQAGKSVHMDDLFAELVNEYNHFGLNAFIEHFKYLANRKGYHLYELHQ